MIDGIDGLSGSISLVSLMLIGLVAFLADNYKYVTLAIALMGGVTGFLYFNLRYPRNYRARVFLGDNGSMLLGFLFAWMFIDLSREKGGP
jgi:UDP-GlcNAc:undecaprenyl-phosphate GlcNAc-1-phosphate transferase